MPLSEYVLDRKFDAGIQIVNPFVGTVPEYECREAAVYVHETWDSWLHNMDSWSRACAVAHYRTSLSLRAHMEDASERASRRRQSRAARRNRGGRSSAE